MKKERINEIWGVFFLLLGLFALASLLFYHPEDQRVALPDEPVRAGRGGGGRGGRRR